LKLRLIIKICIENQMTLFYRIDYHRNLEGIIKNLKVFPEQFRLEYFAQINAQSSNLAGVPS
jgi:hypothetical protein